MAYCIKNGWEYLEGGFDTKEDAEFHMHEHYNASVCIVVKENRFYGFNFKDGTIDFIGRFDEVEEADSISEDMGKNYAWIFDDQNLSKVRKSLGIALTDDVGEVERYKDRIKTTGDI